MAGFVTNWKVIFSGILTWPACWKHTNVDCSTKDTDFQGPQSIANTSSQSDLCVY